MKKLALLLALCLPAMAQAEVWRWKDRAGRLHYSNVPEHVPPQSTTLSAGIGFIEVDVPRPDLNAIAGDLARFEEMRRVHALRRRLDEIQHAKARLEATRRAHYERLYGGAITPPALGLQASPEWRALDAEEARLRHELATLEQREARLER